MSKELHAYVKQNEREYFRKLAAAQRLAADKSNPQRNVQFDSEPIRTTNL